MAQTAVEWLEFEINRRGPKEDNPPQWLKELYEQAKEMHKKEIIDSHTHGFSEGLPYGMSPTGYKYLTAEQYYNEKFKKD